LHVVHRHAVDIDGPGKRRGRTRRLLGDPAGARPRPLAPRAAGREAFGPPADQPGGARVGGAFYDLARIDDRGGGGHPTDDVGGGVVSENCKLESVEIQDFHFVWPKIKSGWLAAAIFV